MAVEVVKAGTPRIDHNLSIWPRAPRFKSVLSVRILEDWVVC